jgi:hypothetical protein
VTECSVALLFEESGHHCDLVSDGCTCLDQALAINSVLLVESDDDTSSGVGDGSSATTASLEGGDTSVILVDLEHVLFVAQADTSLSWLTVSVTSGDGSIEFVDQDFLDLARRLFELVLVLLELWEVGRESPWSAILTVDGSSTADVRSDPLIGFKVQLVEDLVDVLLPVTFNHCLCLLVIWRLFYIFRFLLASCRTDIFKL